MEKKETTPRRAARRSYEERNKDKRKQTSGNFGTMIPRDLFDEINAFLDNSQGNRQKKEKIVDKKFK